jgi:hypothetical protein
MADLPVEKGKERVANIDDMHLGPEGGERAPILASDHPGADRRHRLGHLPKIRDRLRSEDLSRAQGKCLRHEGRRSGRDENVFSAQEQGLRAGPFPVLGGEGTHAHRVRVDQGGLPAENLRQSGLDPGLKSMVEKGPHVLIAAEKVGNRRLPIHGQLHPGEFAVF